MVKTVTEPAPQKKKRVIRRGKQGDRYRHYDPETGAMLNGGPGKPRPSRRLEAEQRRDYRMGLRLSSAMGEALEAILKQTGESKTALITRIIQEWLDRSQPESPDSKPE